MLDFYLYKIGEVLACLLPWRFAYKLSNFFSFLQFCISKKDREAVVNNLKIILPELSKEQIWKKAKQVFENFGMYLVEFFKFKNIDLDFVRKHFIISGKEILDQTLRDGRGAIILTAHIGNWELAGMALSLLGYKVMAIALDHKDSRVNDFFKRRREAKGMEVVSLGVSIRHCYKGLRENKLVAILGDRDFSNSHHSFKFLSRVKNIPRGPAVLSLRTGAPIIPAFVTREGLNNFKIECFPAIIASSEEDEIGLMNRYVSIIEKQIYKYPTQWLMFREFWKE